MKTVLLSVPSSKETSHFNQDKQSWRTSFFTRSCHQGWEVEFFITKNNNRGIIPDSSPAIANGKNAKLAIVSTNNDIKG
jgi:hypothetical protein